MCWCIFFPKWRTVDFVSVKPVSTYYAAVSSYYERQRLYGFTTVIQVCSRCGRIRTKEFLGNFDKEAYLWRVRNEWKSNVKEEI